MKPQLRGQRGQVLMLILVAMVAIIGCVAISGDIGYLQYERAQMQTAADSAAIAASQELNYGDVVAAGQADAATNGFTNGQKGVTVTINNPPKSGPNTANDQYVEAIVAQPVSTFFLRALGFTSINVSARAVSAFGNSPNCMYITDPSAASAMLVNGNINIQSSCGILVDSSSSTGLLANGNITIDAQTIGVVGNYLANGNVSLTPTPRTGMIAAADPLAYVSAPTVGSCTHTNFTLNGNNGSHSSYYQLYPGVYCGGILLNGNTYANFNAGTYILAGGGMTVNGNAWLTGAGITFYNTTGTGGYQAITLNGNTQANFSAPTSGALAGILFFQDRSVSSSSPGSIINGNSSSTFDGALYFPTTQLTYNGNSSSSGYTIIVADKLLINGNSHMGNNYSSLADGSPIKAATLAE
ncbi:MAG TPA: pilus assembly protein TadG-related protein [Candidatus Binataceae bacterium]|nr:pilus assembly protein TadG-related protein [Candidatus Binataceae bacterium]